MPYLISLSNSEKVAIVDDEDAHLVAGRTWYLLCNGYVMHCRWNSGRKEYISLHRLICGAKPGELVDHINHDQLDNRRENVRVATRAQNNQNRRMKTRTVSGLKGVTVRQNKASRTWRAIVRSNGSVFYLGTFRTPEAAQAAYVAKARQLHGEFWHP